jgi:hypothetical protein
LEYEAISTFDPKPLLFLRHVDDIYAEWPDKLCPVEDFLHHLNSQWKYDTKFTIEIEKEGSLAFLDVLVKRAGDTLTSSAYKKRLISGPIYNIRPIGEAGRAVDIRIKNTRILDEEKGSRHI